MSCIVCGKKLGLIPFVCKCGAETCSKHRWPEHSCTFDYKKESREKLAKENPKIVAPKLTKV